MVASTLMTLDEFMQLPDDGFRHELIRGRLHRTPIPTAIHGRTVSVVSLLLSLATRDDKLGTVYGRCGFILPGEPDTLVAPDLAFVGEARLPIDEDDYPVLAPDLVVEVIDPSDSAPAIAEKIDLYVAVGVRLVLAIDPVKRTVRVRRPDGTDRLLTARDTLDGEDVLPGFSVPVARLFA